MSLYLENHDRSDYSNQICDTRCEFAKVKRAPAAITLIGLSNILKKEINVLDIGPSNGFGWRRIMEVNLNVNLTVVETCHCAIVALRKLQSNFHKRLTIIERSAQQFCRENTEQYDMVHGSYSFPYFAECIPQILNFVRDGGYVVCHLYGKNHTLVADGIAIAHSKEEINQLFYEHGLRMIYLDEKTVKKGQITSHIFHIVARRS